MPDDLEPLDSAESLWRALRKEAGLTRVGQFVVAAVFLASALAAVVGYEWLGFIRHSEHRALIAGSILGAGLIVGPLLALSVAGLDAGIRKLFGIETKLPAPAVSADEALLEAHALGSDHWPWTDAATARAAELLPALLAAGYAQEDPGGRTWSLTDSGLARIEELGAA